MYQNLVNLVLINCTRLTRAIGQILRYRIFWRVLFMGPAEYVSLNLKECQNSWNYDINITASADPIFQKARSGQNELSRHIPE